mgnify:CR=1 FL=1
METTGAAQPAALGRAARQETRKVPETEALPHQMARIRKPARAGSTKTETQAQEQGEQEGQHEQKELGKQVRMEMEVGK